MSIISDYLKSLGATSDEVAASLRSAGIKGKRGCYKNCIIIRAIYKNCPDIWNGLVITGSPVIGYIATYSDAQIMDPQLPPPVNEFIQRFDLGVFPDLEESPV